MSKPASHHLPECPTCESREIQIYGPLNDAAPVYCTDCGDETMTFRERVSELQARIAAQERERRLRHLH